ncbi:MAG: hypothetical protein ACPG66_01600 [Flavobacteriales bacterium]
MENEMLIPVILAGVFTAMAVLGVAIKKGFYARLGYFLFGGMVMTFNLLGLAAGEGGMVEIMSIGMFACQTIIMYPWVPEEVDFSHEAIRTLALRLTTTVFIINATATWLILTMPDFPQLLAGFHGILAIIMLMRIAMILKGGVTKT